jgi:hypothetical protein
MTSRRQQRRAAAAASHQRKLDRLPAGKAPRNEAQLHRDELTYGDPAAHTAKPNIGMEIDLETRKRWQREGDRPIGWMLPDDRARPLEPGEYERLETELLARTAEQHRYAETHRQPHRQHGMAIALQRELDARRREGRKLWTRLTLEMADRLGLGRSDMTAAHTTDEYLPDTAQAEQTLRTYGATSGQWRG